MKFLNQMNIKIKKLNKNAVIPFYSKKGDAGLDLTAVSMTVKDTGKYGYIEYDTGIALEIPENHVGLIFPRSSISNTGLILANGVGVADSTYRGSIKCRFKAIPGSEIYSEGDRVAQLIVLPYPQITFEEVEELSETERKDGGFGSSGK
jgi:dUTP pyrophosphatase